MRLFLPVNMKAVTEPSTAFLKQIEHVINRHKMIRQGDKILVAVSGGPDSVALVLSLLAFQKTFDMSIGITHVNHLLRGDDSLRDEQFVRSLAQQLGLDFFCEQTDVNSIAKQNRWSVEEAGREVRYGFFSRLSDQHGFNKVATGHTKDDNAELVLMNLLRGSGPKGLCGIPANRGNTFIRPLIQVSKKQIVQFLENQNQAYMIDASNTDMTYLRNKIRYDLLPRLQSDYNPSITDALDRLSHILTIEDEYMDSQAEHSFSSCLIQMEVNAVRLDKIKLQNLVSALQNRVIRKAILMVKKDLKRISHVHLTDIIKFCLHSSSGKSLDLPGRVRIYKSKNNVIIKKEARALRHIGKQEKNARTKLRKRV